MADDRKLIVCAIAGSLRRGSYNRALIAAAAELAPDTMEIRTFEGLRDIPPYDYDLESAGEPDAVIRLKRALAEADALLIATPEYNYGVPGVLKNAIDWASRPPASSPLRGLPAAIMGASTGTKGTARAQLALRQNFVFTDTPAVLHPEVLVGQAREKFDQDGHLLDEVARRLIGELLHELDRWARALARPR